MAIEQTIAEPELTGIFARCILAEAVATGNRCNFETTSTVVTDTGFSSANKQPDVCPASGGGGSWAKQDMKRARCRR